MNVKKIEEILNGFIRDSSYKSILIDGPWGCGKTHQINEFLKNKKLKKMYYLSLFGLETVDEINTSLFNQIHRYSFRKALRTIFNNMSLISKVNPALSPLKNITDALDNQLKIPKKKISKPSLIILDDLERIGMNIDYINLMGYLNGLFLSRCRIICLISSENIQEEKLDTFHDFKEKVFDCVYQINETNEEILNKVFEDFNIFGIQESYPILGNNIRLAKKVALFYNEIIEIFKSQNKDIKNTIHDELLIFKSAIYTVKISLESFNKPENKNEITDNNAKIYGENIAYGLFHYFNSKETELDLRIIYKVTKLMLDIFIFKNALNFNQYFFNKISKNNESVLDRYFYYLSDENKKIYFCELEKYILENNCTFESISRKVSDIILYSSFEFSHACIKKLAYLYIEKYAQELEYLSFHFNLDEPNEKNKTRANNFVTIMNTEIKKALRDDVLLKLDNFTNKLNYKDFYHFLSPYVYENKKECIEDISEKLIINNFYLPNLSDDIEENEWRFSHLIAKYSYIHGLGKQFILHLENLCKENKENQSLIERCHSLIYYNIDKQYNIENLTRDNILNFTK